MNEETRWSTGTSWRREGEGEEEEQPHPNLATSALARISRKQSTIECGTIKMSLLKCLLHFFYLPKEEEGETISSHLVWQHFHLGKSSLPFNRHPAHNGRETSAQMRGRRRRREERERERKHFCRVTLSQETRVQVTERKRRGREKKRIERDQWISNKSFLTTMCLEQEKNDAEGYKEQAVTWQ